MLGTTALRRRTFAKALLCGLTIVAAAAAAPKIAEEKQTENRIVTPRQGKREVIQLFNGKDLSNWEGHSKYWSVIDGEIVGKNTKRVKVSTYLLTERSFTDFQLLFQVKLVESERHTGVAFWGRKAPKHGDPFTFAGHLVICPVEWGLYDLYGRKSLDVDRSLAERVEKAHDWNEIEILAQGNRIRVVVNGAPTIDYYDQDPNALLEGPIGLQLHANTVPQEFHYKGLLLTTFPDDKLTTLRSIKN